MRKRLIRNSYICNLSKFNSVCRHMLCILSTDINFSYCVPIGLFSEKQLYFYKNIRGSFSQQLICFQVSFYEIYKGEFSLKMRRFRKDRVRPLLIFTQCCVFCEDSLLQEMLIKWVLNNTFCKKFLFRVISYVRILIHGRWWIKFLNLFNIQNVS